MTPGSTTVAVSSDDAGDGDLGGLGDDTVGRTGEGGAVFLGEEVITTCQGQTA